MSDPAVPKFTLARLAARDSRQAPRPSPGPGDTEARLEQLLAQLEEAQAEIDRLRTQAEHLGRLATLGTLSATVAHEFNNLLTPPSAYAKMALKDLERDPQDFSIAHKALTKCANGSDKAQRICAAILDFAQGRSTSGSCTVTQVLDEALLAMGRELSQDGIQLARDVAPDLAVPIDPVELEHVLLNLIINARDAMLTQGGRRGTLRIKAWVTEDAAVAIQVADTGSGIPPELLDQIFQPFFTTRSRRPAASQADGDPLSRSGTGLGLSLCRQIVERYGGSLTAHSTPGSGSQFTILLPAAVAPVSAAA